MGVRVDIGNDRDRPGMARRVAYPPLDATETIDARKEQETGYQR